MYLKKKKNIIKNGYLNFLKTSKIFSILYIYNEKVVQKYCYCLTSN